MKYRKFSKIAVWALGATFFLGDCTASLLENEYESSEVIEVVTIESLNIQLKDLSKSMSDYKSKINLLASYIIEMQNKVNALDDQEAYSEIKSKVDDMDGKVTAFEDALKNLEGFTDVNTWVSDLNAGLNSLSALQEAVNDAKDGITSIVTRLNGLDETTAGIASELSTKTEALLAGLESCSADISGILTRLGALEGNVAALQAEIAALIASVQSVVVVPDYSDGSVKLANQENNIVRFEIQPLSAAQRLAEIGQSAFSFDYVETTTKAAALHHLPITSVSFDGEFVSVTVDGYAIPEMTNLSENSINARLLISDGEIVRGSEYFCVTVTMVPPTDISVNGTANCYIVSSRGGYSFPPVKGNSSESVGAVASAEVLWESFGTDVKPSVGDIIHNVAYEDGAIRFYTPSTLKNGNAVIAAKDASGNILWSWHIWVCQDFDPIATEQVYYNDAGTMMDRNLGATSATPGDVGALGLLYQWGRKDPFMSGGGISSNIQATSTLSIWPSPVESDSNNGTIVYVVSHPTTFVTDNSINYDWYYTGNNNTDNTRWQSQKSIYDPCPAGWKVPSGGLSGVWSTAVSSSDLFYSTWDSSNMGMNFSGNFGTTSIIWYPAAGLLHCDDGLVNVGQGGRFWSYTPNGRLAYDLRFGRGGDVYPSSNGSGQRRAYALSVRCQKDVPAPAPVVTRTDLSATETANCYVVSSAGAYRFKGNVKGNSSTALDGTPVKAELLWETFGTDVTPNVNDVIASVSYKDEYVEFDTPETLINGNAVIAAKDAAGEILWSWHIWVCKDFDPVATGQVYYNDAGTMMDRNLGATSATPGDVGALGLLYQWGRKDPFLTGDSISSSTKAKSTLSSWPSPVSSNSGNGTIEYTVKNPTTFITYNFSNYDWYYPGSSSTDNNRWKSTKTIYDPCPPGWKVPAGGSSGVWSKAANTTSGSFSHTWNSTNKGMNFSNKFGSAGTIWYPAAGCLDNDDGSLYKVGDRSYWWSCTPDGDYAYGLYLIYDGNVLPSDGNGRAYGLSVRCQKEETPSIDFNTATNLSSDGTANCYVVPAAGTYKFSSVKGNSSTSVGSVSSVEVLWESFGTNKTPSVGDIIADVAFADGFVGFKTPATLKNGNAVIAAKNSSGTILWSWHIWVCKDFDPVATGQEYYNNAGTMMDRNIGATSATPGDVGALGLLYQWGRKDPFLGGGSISSNTQAASTLSSWPSPVESDSNNGTIEYVISHPTTFVKYTTYNWDWYYTGSSSTDNTRWQSTKTIYDPCPSGWRVPDGGSDGVWSKVVQSSSDFSNIWSSSSRGMNFSSKFGSVDPIWYPATGSIYRDEVSLRDVGSSGHWWSCTPNDYYVYGFYLYSNGNVSPGLSTRSYGQSVRCQKDVPTPDPAPVVTRIELSATETANCYVVSSAGAYKFKGNVKGNSNTLLDSSPVKAELLWETFGTDVTPNVNDVIASVSYEDGYVEFDTPETLKNGNAVIAAKDADDNILWSWHIWVCKDFDPVATGQVYYNNAGTMMDRNLGATSATPGDVGALGLLYQWGRKDPFLTGDSISSITRAKSTLSSWPSPVTSDSSKGTIAYAVKNPTTFIGGVSGTSYDWLFSSRDNTLWQSSKTIYDPCPPGWRVPDGGSSGVWSKAANTSSSFSHTWDSTNKGMNFSNKFGSAGTIWYPAAGWLDDGDGSLYGVGNSGYWWSCTPNVSLAYYLSLNRNGDVYPSGGSSRAFGSSVRCLQE